MASPTQPATDTHGTPIVHMWDCPMPDPSRPGAGFPILAHAVHHTLFRPSLEDGAYNHHPQLVRHGAWFHAVWSNHPHGEDGPGQRVLYSRSRDAQEWTAPVELAPPPGPVHPSEATGLACTAFGWRQLGDRLFALIGLHRNTGFHSQDRQRLNPERSADYPFRARHGYSPILREVLPDASFGAPFALRPNLAADLAWPLTPEPDLAAALQDSPTCQPPWDFEGRGVYPAKIDGGGLCEPTIYPRPDGGHTMLLRDDRYSHRMYVSHLDAARGVWPPAHPTDIPDSPSLACTLALPSGTVLLIGNQVAPVFDDPDAAKHLARDPLTVAVSPDGRRFTRCLALRAGRQPLRVPGLKGRGPGSQYPSACLHAGRLYVLYSIGKEDIAITHVALEEVLGAASAAV